MNTIERILSILYLIYMSYKQNCKESWLFISFCNDQINCTRILLGIINGKLEIIKSYVRFETIDSGFVKNYADGGVLCYLERDGSFVQGNIMNKKI